MCVNVGRVCSTTVAQSVAIIYGYTSFLPLDLPARLSLRVLSALHYILPRPSGIRLVDTWSQTLYELRKGNGFSKEAEISVPSLVTEFPCRMASVPDFLDPRMGLRRPQMHVRVYYLHRLLHTIAI